MRLFRIALFASIAVCSASAAWAQYGLYGAPEPLRVPQQNVAPSYPPRLPAPTYAAPSYAAPTTGPSYTAPAGYPNTYYPGASAYPSTSAPMVQPAPRPAYYQPYPSYSPYPPPQYRYAAQPPATAMYQPYQPGLAIPVSESLQPAAGADDGCGGPRGLGATDAGAADGPGRSFAGSRAGICPAGRPAGPARPGHDEPDARRAGLLRRRRLRSVRAVPRRGGPLRAGRLQSRLRRLRLRRLPAGLLRPVVRLRLRPGAGPQRCAPRLDQLPRPARTRRS